MNHRNTTVKSPLPLKTLKHLMLTLVAATLTLQPVQSQSNDDIEKAGFVHAYSCGNGGVNIETIPGLDGQGIDGTDKFISATSVNQLAGAGFVWSKFKSGVGERQFGQINILYDGDPNAVDVRFCLRDTRTENRGPEWQTVEVRLKDFFQRKDPGDEFTVASLANTQIFGRQSGQRLNLDILNFEIDRVLFRVTEIKDKPETVRFGKVTMLFGGNTYRPTVISSPVTGFRGCDFERDCGPSFREGLQEGLRRVQGARRSR